MQTGVAAKPALFQKHAGMQGSAAAPVLLTHCVRVACAGDGRLRRHRSDPLPSRMHNSQGL
ncbi:hypothetical protein [Xanthomonas arboricola]|uniref:hypothetical protein n=1 Tax=Xanthomonas arboricola TaxID=56448 RepID=UPI0003A56605|nr:hypothetical protein PUV44_05925 [Xanthomonas arboricola pv. corylina]